MALLALASAKGAPGVTTTALLFGALWARPVIVAECDPSGGDAALRMPAEDGHPLDAQSGLLSLVAAGRRSLQPELVRMHTQRASGGLDVLVGPSMSEQAGGLTAAWAQLGPLLARLRGTDVVADLGRIGAHSPQNAMLSTADAVVLLVDTSPSSVVHLRNRLRPVSDAIGGSYGAPLHVVVVAPPKRTQAVREIRDAIADTDVPVAGVHHLAADERGADIFQGQPHARPDKLALVRSARPIVEELLLGTEQAHVPTDEYDQDGAGAVEPAEGMGVNP